MKKLFYLLFILVVFVSCNKEELNENIKPSNTMYLVDKVYDYNNNLIAEYIYDDSNQLILRKDRDTVHSRSSDYVFIYNKEQLEQIIYLDYDMPQFNHEIHLEYDASGKIISDFTTKSGKEINNNYYSYDKDNRIVAIYKVTPEKPYYLFYYDDAGNVRESVLVMDVSNDPMHGGKDTIHVHRFFRYDKKPKANFSLNNVFQVEMYPYFGTEATLEKALSVNNMTEFVNGTTWDYRYTEEGLPEEIETKWKDVTMLSPLIHRITYKEVKAP